MAVEVANQSASGRGKIFAPASLPVLELASNPVVCLELKNGDTFQGAGFGAIKSVAGELVFQTGII
jgi:hypothetical protein